MIRSRSPQWVSRRARRSRLTFAEATPRDHAESASTGHDCWDLKRACNVPQHCVNVYRYAQVSESDLQNVAAVL